MMKSFSLDIHYSLFGVLRFSDTFLYRRSLQGEGRNSETLFIEHHLFDPLHPDFQQHRIIAFGGRAFSGVHLDLI